MSIKILGGSYKALKLKVPTEEVRPTAVMLKRKIFDSRQFLEGIIFYDLCAGSGSVGLEALSRGADFVYFIERGERQVNIIKSNISLIPQDHEKVKVIKQNVISWVNHYVNRDLDKSMDHILYFDPPYNEKQIYLKVLTQLFSCPAFNGEVWVEIDLKQPFVSELAPFLEKYFVKKFKHGDHAIYILKKHADIDQS